MSRRGGLGVRKSMSEKIAAAKTYRLIGVPAGSRVAETDKYRRWHLGYRLGYIMRITATSVTVQWDGESEFSFYTAVDARYLVDTNRWRIVPPTSQSPLDALTSGSGDASIMLSPPDGAHRTEEEVMPPKKKGGTTTRKSPKKVEPQVEEVIVDDELEDDEVDDTTEAAVDPAADEVDDDELDDVDPEVTLEEVAQAVEKAQGKATPPEPAGETYTAKQVATRLGTDSKTLRKFFRSSASTVEPVGQGGRYEFDKADLPKIKAEFDKWNTGKTVKGTPNSKNALPKSRKKASRMDTAPAVVDDDDEELDLDDELEDEEPTDADLADVEVEDELDDDELDD